MSRTRKKHRFKRRPINVLASALTICGLYCGIASIFYAISALLAQSNLYTHPSPILDNAIDMSKFSATMIFFAIIFDMLDGTVAKLTNTTSEFGKQLDSLCDLVSFGVAPGVLIFTLFLNQSLEDGGVTAPLGSGIAVIFVMCGALRLARYNVYQATRRDYFTGLPIPAAGGTIAAFVLFRTYFEMGDVALWILGPMSLGLAYLMVSTLRYPKDKMKSLVLAPGSALQLLALMVLAIAAFHYASERSPAIVLFPASLLYVFVGIVDFIIGIVRKRPAQDAESTPSEEPHP